MQESARVSRAPWQRLSSLVLALGPIIFIFPLVMVAIVLHAIWTTTPTVPFEDEWENLLMLHHVYTGTFSLSELWAFHNQHRIVIPSAIEIMLVEITHYNRQIMMSFDVGVALLTTVLFHSAARRLIANRWLSWALLVPFSLAALSLGQWEDWLEPFQLTFFLTIFGYACCVRGLAEDDISNTGFLITLAGSIIAALSSLSGCLAFFAFLPGILLYGWKRTLIWVAVAAGVLIPYFIGFPHSTILSDLGSVISYAVAYLGGPVSAGHVVRAVLIATASIIVMLACIGVYWLQHYSLKSILPWVSLGLCGMGAAGSTALGRYSGGSLALAFSSRYQAFSAVWWIAVFGVVAVCLSKWTSAPGSATAATAQWLTWISRLWAAWASMALAGGALVITLMVANQQYAKPALENFQLAQKQQEQCIVLYLQSQPPCFQYYYPTSGKAQAYSAMMQQDGLGPFYQPTGNVGVDPTTVPAGALRLDRYVDHAARTYWTVVSLNKDQWDPFLGPNYQLDAPVGYLLSGPQAAPAGVATHPIYGCVLNSVEFLSNDITCGGGGLLQVEGWAYDSAPISIHTVPLFECQSAQRNIVSNEPQCPAGTTGIILGFARENP